MFNNFKNRFGISFIEVMIAALLLVVLLLPIYNFLTNSVKDTEHIYVEVMATSRAKQIMDTILFQLPWRALREGNPCIFNDPLQDDPVKKDYPEVKGSIQFIKDIIPQIMGEECQLDSKSFKGDGIYKSEKGFWIRARVKVVDLDKNLTINILRRDGSIREFELNELTSKDADGKYNLVKKVIVQVKWSWLKGLDPNKDPHAKSLFLVGFKSNLEG